MIATKLGIGKMAIGRSVFFKILASLFLNVGPAALACPVSQISNQAKGKTGGNEIRGLTDF